MDFKGIQNLMKEMNQSELTLLEIESDGVHIKMQKNIIGQPIEVNPLVPIPNTDKPPLHLDTPLGLKTDISSSQKELNIDNESYKNILSPIVGTFYQSKGPGKPILANIGDKVKKGQVLCIIEAMKLMNEIESEYDGEIVEILVENEQMVEYNQPLFKINVL